MARVLGIETSSIRGSVALVERGAVVCSAGYEVENGHAERLLPLLEATMATAGWARTSLDRVAVGTGPGSFTGLRVGIALAEGLSMGLGIPLLGVGSLRAMARATPSSRPELRCPLLDARRNEVFAAIYRPSGEQLMPPTALAREGAIAELGRRSAEAFVLLGRIAAELCDGTALHRSPETDLPHASSAALEAEHLPVSEAPWEPLYIRPVDAIRPSLPPSPLC